jgi:hypothetical protein
MATSSGQESLNLPTDVNRVPYTLFTHSVLTALAIIVVAFRCAARFKSGGLKVDDYCMVGAMVRYHFLPNLHNKLTLDLGKCDR